MLTLGIPPIRTSYAVTTQDGIDIKHDGPRSAIRRGTKNVRKVKATWKVGPTAYQYLRAFFRTGLKEGSEPFIAQLVFEGNDITLHKAQFVPGTFRTTEVTNYSFTVEGDLLFERTKL